METQADTSSLAVMERLRRAINQHDLDAMAQCFAPDYRSTFPVHPGRAVGGREQMRKNWSQIFADVPDIHADVLRSCVSSDTVWTEWDWTGTRGDGAAFHHRGVTVQGVEQDQIVWVRLYMEPVQEDGGRQGAGRDTQ